jgi:endoglucanase
MNWRKGTSQRAVQLAARLPGRPGLSGLRPAAAVAAALLAAAACGTASGASHDTAHAPPAPARLYAYPGNPLYAAASLLSANGHGAEAAKLRQIADTPSGIWLAGESYDMQEARRVTLAAGKAHAVPVIVTYNLPDRDACGKFSGAYGPTAAGYKQWINQLAAAIGAGDDIIVVEPDGLPDIVRGCLSPAQAAERYALLRYAMRRLGALPHARVYLDAGNPGLFPDPAHLVGPLERAGIRYGRGFSANVSNFQWTADVVAWSQQLEHGLGGRAGAVVDTSRNGNGPYTGPDAPQWCNPPGRALGVTPRLDPGPAGIDAYLWIKDPGASDGPCNGGPAAGQYWPQYALDLLQASEHR